MESEEEHGDEVEAEFESGAHDSKITVRLVNGSPSAIVRERDDGAHDSDNSGHGSDREDDHGGGSGRG